MAGYMADLEPVPDAVKPGSIVVIYYDDKVGRMFYITVKSVVGPIKGKGWLVITKTMKLALITLSEQVEISKSKIFPFKIKTGEVHFIWDTDTANKYLYRAGATIKPYPGGYQVEYPYDGIDD